MTIKTLFLDCLIQCFYRANALEETEKTEKAGPPQPQPQPLSALNMSAVSSNCAEVSWSSVVRGSPA